MDNIINLQRRLVPELTDLMLQRYQVLRQINLESPIGRRSLSVKVGITERILRAHLEFLKQSGLIEFAGVGMSITEEGTYILRQLEEYVRKLQDLSTLEKQLETELKIGKVVILPGDSDLEEVVKKEIGRASARILCEHLEDGKKHVVAVSGGTTMAYMAANISGSYGNTLFVPARGGLGDNVDNQANTIATQLAQNLHAAYRLLYLPDNVSQETMNSILEQDAGTRGVVDIIKHADILVHGIGRASVMARHRNLPHELIERFGDMGIRGEAFGQYCGLDGKQVYMSNNAGLMLQDLKNIGTIIGLAGGHTKAAAIISVIRASHQDILITDEGAAREMVRIISCK